MQRMLQHGQDGRTRQAISPGVPPNLLPCAAAVLYGNCTAHALNIYQVRLLLLALDAPDFSRRTQTPMTSAWTEVEN